VTEALSISREAPGKLLGSPWVRRDSQFPEDSLARSVREKADQADGLTIQVLDRIVKPIHSVLIVPSRERVVKMKRPVFFLKGSKKG
jgi:hypothetical protein